MRSAPVANEQKVMRRPCAALRVLLSNALASQIHSAEAFVLSLSACLECVEGCVRRLESAR